MSAFYTWALDRGWVDATPLVHIRSRSTSRSRDRVLSDEELRVLWLACDDSDFGRIVKLLVLTAQRRTEIGALRWTEINFDEGLIEFPATRVKNATAHSVPLTQMAVAVIQSIPKRGAQDCMFGRAGGGFTGWSKAKRELDARIAARRHAMGLGPMRPWGLHDLRRTAATGLARLGVAPQVVDRILNHRSGIISGVRAIYNRFDYLPEARDALNRWAEHVASVVQ